MDNLFGWSNGSTDKVKLNINGREWMKLFRFNKQKKLYVFACVCNFFQSSTSHLLTIAQGELTTVLVNANFDTAEDFLESINKVSMIIMITILIKFFVSIVTEFSEQSCLPLFKRDLKVGIFNIILEQDITYFDKYQVGVILSRLNEDVDTAFDNYANNLTLFSYYFAQLFSGILICFYYSWKATFYIITCFPIYILSEYLNSKYITKLYLKYNDKKTNVSAKAEEILTSFRTVKSFESEIKEYHSYRQKLFEVNSVISDTALISSIKNFVQMLTNLSLQSFILFFMGNQAVNKEVDTGAITTVIYIVNLWNHTITSIFEAYDEFIKSNISSAKLLEIINRKQKINLKEGRIIDIIKGSIEFRNVSFKYPTRDKYALKNISFKVNQGETVAIVGESGCGKSTILQLLQRFYDTTSGQILIDGINIQSMNPVSLRSHIAIVQQSPVIFSMSVKDNILFGKSDADKEDVIHAAIISNAHSFIQQLKNGYKTLINQNSLSGGQKQRICIARALLMNSSILLLDEATSSLDTESEKLIHNSLYNFRFGKTVVIVAHRLATVKIASKIIVMNDGEIIQEGSHNELISQSGEYIKLVKNQMQ